MRAVSIASKGKVNFVDATSLASSGRITRLGALIRFIYKEVMRLYSTITKSINLRSTLDADN